MPRYPAELEEDVELRDGTRVHVRPMRPDDVAREQRLFDSLSERSRYQRFLQPLRHLPPQLLARFTHPDYERELALVALKDDAFVAVGRYAPNADGKTAEFALVVDDAWQGKGLGGALLERLCRAARKAGYQALYGHVLATNRAMRELAKRVGFTERSHRDGEVIVGRELA